MGKSLSRGMIAPDYLSMYRRNEMEADLRTASEARMIRRFYTSAIAVGCMVGGIASVVLNLIGA